MAMTSPHTICAFWGTDERSPSQCATALSDFLTKLADEHPLLSVWYSKANSKRAALAAPLDLADLEAIERYLKPNRRDTDDSVIEELGREVGLWNGHTGPKAASLDLNCGLTATESGLCNNLSLELPPAIVESTSTIRTLLRHAIDVWQPAWAAVYSWDATSGKTFGLDTPLVDWMLFLSHVLVDETRLPKPTVVERIDCRGSVIQTQNEPLDYDDCSQRTRIKEVRKILSEYCTIV